MHRYCVTAGDRNVWEATKEDQRQVYAARARAINVELKKRRLEVFSDKPGPSTVPAPAPYAARPLTVPAPSPYTAGHSTVPAPVPYAAEPSTVPAPAAYMEEYLMK